MPNPNLSDEEIDDLIAAGPAIGGPAVSSFMDDIAAQQEPAMNKVATPTVTTGTMVTEDPTFDYTSTSVTTTPLAEVTDDGIEDYERRPTPFALLADGEGNRVGGTQTVNLLYGSGLIPPGTGFLLNQAIFQRDLPLLQGTILVLALFFVLLNLLVDIAQAAIDPRIKRS